jgi:hypothetical protein
VHPRDQPARDEDAPAPARRKRTGPTSEPEFLCLQHAEKQETRDQLVTQKLALLRSSQGKKKAR